MARLTTLKPRIPTLGATRRDPDKTWSGDVRKTTERGLGWTWQKLRLVILQRDTYLCQCPECKGGEVRVMAATEVDHIKPRAWFADGRAIGDPDDPSNLRAVSRECHRRITLEQQGKKPSRRDTAPDGWPLDRR
jgi:5-methylcytosine-specific restriction enzyme A